MNTYIECCNCGHQWKLVGNVTSTKCEKCGSTQVNLDMGVALPPDWWNETQPGEKQ